MRLRVKMLAILSVLCVSAFLCGCLGGEPSSSEVTDTEQEAADKNSNSSPRSEDDEVEDLISDLKEDNWGIRVAAAQTLGEIGDPRAVDPLIEALKDQEWSVQVNAIQALGEIGDPRAVDPLIEALKDETSGTRGFAAQSLGEIGDPRAVDPLIKALKDEEWSVRSSAAKALGEIGDDRAVDPLTDALNDEEESVQKSAEEALEKLGVEENQPITVGSKLDEESQELAILSIEGYSGVQDAAVSQDGNQLSLAIVVDYGTNEEYAKELGDNFVRLIKTFGPEENPEKEIGPGVYDYIIGIYYPNGDTVALGAKANSARNIYW